MNFLAWLKGGVLAIAAFLLWSLVGLGLAEAGSISCPERPAGYVSDFARVMGDVSGLEKELDEFEQETSHEIYVVSVSSLEDNTIEDYASTLYNKWSVGKESLDNGALLLVGVEDRQVYLKTGYGLGSQITTKISQEIIDEEIAPAFSAGDYRGGVEKGVGSIIQAAQGDYDSSPEFEEEDNHSRWVFLVVFLLIVPAIVIISGRFGQGHNGRGRVNRKVSKRRRKK